jgi:hypothetical protein
MRPCEDADWKPSENTVFTVVWEKLAHCHTKNIKFVWARLRDIRGTSERVGQGNYCVWKPGTGTVLARKLRECTTGFRN